MTVIGFFLTVIAVCFVALIGIKVTPVYLEYFRVVRMMKSVQGDMGLAAKGEQAIRQTLSRRMDIDMFTGVSMKDVKIARTSEGYEVTIAWENRFGLLGNLDGVAAFSKKIVLNN
jgi:hypothetical protein